MFGILTRGKLHARDLISNKIVCVFTGKNASLKSETQVQIACLKSKNISRKYMSRIFVQIKLYV